jgi:hypothetical protein
VIVILMFVVLASGLARHSLRRSELAPHSASHGNRPWLTGFYIGLSAESIFPPMKVFRPEGSKKIVAESNYLELRRKKYYGPSLAITLRTPTEPLDRSGDEIPLYVSPLLD